jgi:outer membrane protein OmpA-like peptidoglycan-associated protein
VSIYSNIVILGTSVLIAGARLPIQHQTSCCSAPPVVQEESSSSKRPSGAPSFFSHQQGSGLNRSKASGAISQATAVAISDPPFLRQPIQFGPNSLELTAAGRNMLKRSAAWLRLHREARILIVGSCDSGGSETCTRTLAEARGAVVRMFLGTSGIDSDQIVGVKGWDNLDQSCQTSDMECQQFNRSARIFMASSVSP